MERLVINIPNRHLEVKFDRASRAVFIGFPNALMPTTRSVVNALEEYATKTPDKKWVLKPAFRERMTQHNKIVKDLADLGIRMGFQVHADIEGYKKDFFPFKVHDQSRVSRIDVVWYTACRAVALYEVENTTGISEAIIRGSNVEDANTVRALVVPEERNSFLKRKIREPILREQIGRYQWKAILYEDLYNFLSRHKRRVLRFEDMHPLMLNLTDFELEIQQSIQAYFPRAESA